MSIHPMAPDGEKKLQYDLKKVGNNMKNMKLNSCLIGIMLMFTVFAAIGARADNLPPVLVVSHMPPPGDAHECEVVLFSTVGSYDPELVQLQYRWDFDDDGIFEVDWSTSQFAEYSWYDNCIGHVTVQATDGENIVTAYSDITIVNVPPEIIGLVAPSVAEIGQVVPVTVTFHDGYDRGLFSADYFTAVFDWGDGSTSTFNIPTDALKGDLEGTLVINITGTHIYSAMGVYTGNVTITDKDGGSDWQTFMITINPAIVPGEGFVTGGGWIPVGTGCYKPDPSITGTANFGFVCKTKKGQTIPEGSTEFNFQEADMNFHIVSYISISVSGNTAKFTGTGTVNGAGIYGFIVTAVDGGKDDSLRMQIWNKATGTTLFDTLTVISLSGGSIVIHKA
jgi:hypothetical protein